MRAVLVIGSGPPSVSSMTATLVEKLSHQAGGTVVVHSTYHEPVTAVYDGYPVHWGLSLYEPPEPLKRIRALPSFTPLRFAPQPKPRAPARQHKREAFVRCYQRRRESKTRSLE